MISIKNGIHEKLSIILKSKKEMLMEKPICYLKGQKKKKLAFKFKMRILLLILIVAAWSTKESLEVVKSFARMIWSN